MRYLKFAAIGGFFWALAAFIPNTLTDRSDRRDVRDAVVATVKTGVSIAGKVAGAAKREFDENYVKTSLPEEQQPAITVKVIVDGKAQAAAK